MIQKVRKAPKIAICRACHGTGEIYSGRLFRKTGPCPQCEGSGRVMVSCDMTLDVRPYRPKKTE